VGTSLERLSLGRGGEVLITPERTKAGQTGDVSCPACPPVVPSSRVGPAPSPAITLRSEAAEREPSSGCAQSFQSRRKLTIPKNIRNPPRTRPCLVFVLWNCRHAAVLRKLPCWLRSATSRSNGGRTAVQRTMTKSPAMMKNRPEDIVIEPTLDHVSRRQGQLQEAGRGTRTRGSAG
jgi:hypothetical protein